MIMTILAIILAYLIGSVSNAVIVCKFFEKPDPRLEGSKNPGATNVLRIAGKKAAISTLLFDLAKGFIAVLIGQLFFLPPLAIGFVAIAVCVGHMYPIFFKFKGGKGVATGLGALLAISPLLGILAAGTWLVMAVLFKYSSLASIVAISLAPFYSIFVTKPGYFVPLLFLAFLMLFRHRENIKRLRDKTETKIELKK